MSVQFSLLVRRNSRRSQQHREEQNCFLESRSCREEFRTSAQNGEDDFKVRWVIWLINWVTQQHVSSHSQSEIFEFLEQQVPAQDVPKLKQLLGFITPKELRHLDFLIYLMSYYNVAAPHLLKAIFEILHEDETNFANLMRNFSWHDWQTVRLIIISWLIVVALPDMRPNQINQNTQTNSGDLILISMCDLYSKRICFPTALGDFIPANRPNKSVKSQITIGDENDFGCLNNSIQSNWMDFLFSTFFSSIAFGLFITRVLFCHKTFVLISFTAFSCHYDTPNKLVLDCRR